MSEKKIILLIEDNEQDELLTIRALKKNNIHNELVVCRDGAEAVDWLFIKGQHSGRNPEIVPQVILLDLKLPKIDGMDVLKEIRTNLSTKRIPVVVLTTSQIESDVIKSYDLGANSFVHKPVDFTEFTEAIKSLGLYWLIINKIAED